jgi:hypothetical protein
MAFATGALICASGALSTGSALGAAKAQPPCTRTALVAGLRRGPARVPNARLTRPWGCAGQFAYTNAVLGGDDITVLLHSTGRQWQTASRARYCKGQTVPKRIRRAACDTN